MWLGRMSEKQGEMFYTWDELPHSPGHPFYDRLQKELEKGGFDVFVENLCALHYSGGRRGRPSLVPGRYFRMHLVGYFEGIDSARDRVEMQRLLGVAGFFKIANEHGYDAARRAVYNNRNRIKSGIGKATMRRRGEMVERSFEHVLDRGGMRRAWLRGQENVSKRYLIHVAGFNLGILMRHLTGKGTPRGWADRRRLFIFVLVTPFGPLFGIGLATDTETISLMLIFASRMGD